MGKVFLSGGSGETINMAGLDVIVMGGPMPEKPKEKTIWVDTEIAITGYIFGTEKPEGYTQGLVWIKTASRSPVEMSVTSENLIMVYPQYAYQCVDEVWVEKRARSFYNNAWHDWRMYLYNKGDHFTRITGGWEDYTQNDDIYAATNYATLGEFDTDMYMHTFRPSSANNQGYLSVAALNKIDVTNYHTLFVDMNWMTNFKSSPGLRVGLIPQPVYNGTPNFQFSAVEANTDADHYSAVGPYLLALDISNITGEWYIGLKTGALDRGMECTVHSIWLE